MTVEQIIEKVYAKLSDKDFSGTEGKLAIQVNLTGKVGGVFYIEILDGALSVMPYEYIDHDAAVSVTMTNLDKILSGKLKTSVAVAERKMTVEGNVDKLLLLDALLQQ